MKTKSTRFKHQEECGPRHKKTVSALFFASILMIVLAWAMEINFHFIQDFTLETTDEITLWKMEAVIAPVSTILLVTGIILLIASITFYKR